MREFNETYAIWTSGTFEADAVAKLTFEKARRTKRPIAWRDGNAVRQIATRHKLKIIGDALNEHFVQHPLTKLPASHGTRAKKTPPANVPVAASVGASTRPA